LKGGNEASRLLAAGVANDLAIQALAVQAAVPLGRRLPMEIIKKRVPQHDSADENFREKYCHSLRVFSNKGTQSCIAICGSALACESCGNFVIRIFDRHPHQGFGNPQTN